MSAIEILSKPLHDSERPDSTGDILRKLAKMWPLNHWQKEQNEAPHGASFLCIDFKDGVLGHTDLAFLKQRFHKYAMGESALVIPSTLIKYVIYHDESGAVEFALDGNDTKEGLASADHFSSLVDYGERTNRIFVKDTEIFVALIPENGDELAIQDY